MEGDKSFDEDGTVPSEFREYLKGMDMQDIQPIQSTSPTHRAKSALALRAKPGILNPIYRSTSADNLNNMTSREASLSPQSSHNTSLEDFKAKAKRKGVVPLPSPIFSLEEELKAKQHKILYLQKQNEELRGKIERSYEGSCKDDFLSQIETISKLKLDCVLKQNEVDRLKAVEVTLKQTKQVLKDTTWALTVKEEELKNIKTDMRDNYESRLSELITRLNDRELKLTSMKNERDALSDKNRDITLRVDELAQQISCYEQELEAKNKQIELRDVKIRTLKAENNTIVVKSATKVESLMEKLRDMERKVNETVSLSSNNEPFGGSSEDGNVCGSVQTFLPTTAQLADQSLDMKEAPNIMQPTPDTMSLEQITLMIQDNANLRLIVEESKQKLQSYMQESENEKKELQKEVAGKGDQINELIRLVDTMRRQMPMNDNMEIYSTGVEQEPEDADEVRSCGSDDEGKQQMSHVVSNYEKRINELQKLYDQDVFSLANENEKLKKEIKELQSNYLNVSHSNTSFALDFEDLKTTYDEKLDNLKNHYEDLLRKECMNAQKQQTELLAENNKLQLIVEEAEKKFMQHLQHMEANMNSNYQTDLTSEVQKIFANQSSSISAIKEDLQRELNDIKSAHCEDLCTVEQEFGLHEANKSGLEDTYSNEILKLTEERKLAQKAAQLLKDELLLMQQEYDNLKELYDSLAFDVDQYKDEKLQLLGQISVLSEESSNLKSSLRSRRNEVEEYKTKITDASKTIEDYTKKLIGKSERSSNASDSLRSELEDLALDISSPRTSASAIKTVEMKKKSNLLTAQVKLLRSNLDEAKSELKNLHEEHGLSTAVYDRLTNILNLLKKYIESDILEQEAELPNIRDGDHVISDDYSPPKLLLDDVCKEKIETLDGVNNENLCDELEKANTFEISENLSLDDDDLSDATAVSDNAFTQQDFEKELRDLKIDIPLDYCNSTLKQDLNKEKDDSSPEKAEKEIHNLRKENRLLQQKIYSLSSDHIGSNIGLSTDFFYTADTSISDSKLDSIKMLLDNVSIFEGNESSGFKKCRRNDFADNVLNDFKSTIDMLQQVNENIGSDASKNAFGSNIEIKISDESEHCISSEESSKAIEQLQVDNKALKDKISELEKDVFNRNLHGIITEQPPSIQTGSSTEDSGKIPLGNIELHNMHTDDVSLKVKFHQREHEVNVPGLSSVILFDKFTTQALIGGDRNSDKSYLAIMSDNLNNERDSSGTSHEIIDDDFDWDNSLAELKKGSPKQMDSEGHTLNQRDSLSKSLSDLEIENENLKKENNSLREEAERDSRTIIGPGFASEILYYEHAQPIDGDSVGIKVDAIKTLLNNVVINQGNDIVRFDEYEGRDVILRLLLDIQVEVVDLIKENNVLKEETVKQKPVASCSVQTGDSIMEVVDGSNESVNDKDLSLNNFLILDDSDASSLEEQDLMECEMTDDLIDKNDQPADQSNICTTYLEEQTLHDDGGDVTSVVKIVEGFVQDQLHPEFTSTVKDVHDCEIVNLGEDNAHIMLKIKQKEKKLILPAFSSMYFSSGHVENIRAMPGVFGSSSEMDIDNQLRQRSNQVVKEVLTKAVSKIKGESEDSSDVALDVKDLTSNSPTLNFQQDQNTIVPGFSSNVLLQEQSIASAAGIDSLGLLVENLIVFEGNEETGYKSSDGNDLTKRFLKDCQAQLNRLKNENTALKLQIYPESQDNLTNQPTGMDTSMQKGLFSEILNYTQHAAVACTKDSKKSSENVQQQQSFIVPGFSSEILQSEIVSSILSSNSSIDGLSPLLENVAIFEGSDADGFTKCEENDIAKKVLNDFKGKIIDLLNDNDALRRKLVKMQAICESRVHDEVITIEEVQPTFTGLEFEDGVEACIKDKEASVNQDIQCPMLVPGFSSELLLSEDVLPFPEVDSLTRKLDALKKLFESLVIFKGNDSVGYVKYDDVNLSLELIKDFEIELNEVKKENLRNRYQMGGLSIPDFDSEISQGTSNHTVLHPCVSTDLDNPIPSDLLDTVEVESSQFGKDGHTQKPSFVSGFSSEMLHSGDTGASFHRETIDPNVYCNLQVELANLRKENALLKKQMSSPEFSSERLYNESSQQIDPAAYHSLQTEVVNLQNENKLLQKNKSEISQEMCGNSQYANGTKNELIDLLLKKDKILDNLIGQQVKGNKQIEYDDTVGAEYEESIRMSRAWMEAVNLQSLSQLREDLDDDYLERIKVVEEKLREAYKFRIRKIAETCDQKVTQIKNDYEEELRKLQESPSFLEETEASLGSYRDSSDDNLFKDDTKDDVDGEMELTEDDIDTCVEIDVTKTKKLQKSQSDKSVNTVSSFGTEDVEQNAIAKLKESLTELFRKPDVEDDSENILFRLDDLEEIMQTNYAKITDMTEKLKGKLCSINKEMGKKFEVEKCELIVQAKNNILDNLASVFNNLINYHTVLVDGKVKEMLNEHEDVNALLQTLGSLAGHTGDAAVTGDEKTDLSEKMERKIEQFFKTGKNILGLLKAEEDVGVLVDGSQKCNVEDSSMNKIEVYQSSADHSVDESVWKKFLKEKDSLPEGYQNELLGKKVEFKSSVDKDFNSLINCINTAFGKVFGQFSQYLDVRTKHKTKVESEMITSLANAHTQMVLKTVTDRYEKNDNTDMLTKMGELLVKEMEPEKLCQHKLKFENVLEQCNCKTVIEDENFTKEKFDGEIENVTKLCLLDAVQALLENDSAFDQIDEEKRLTFLFKMDDLQNANLEECTRLKKELNDIRQQIDETVAKNVKKATDIKFSEFESAKMDIVKQHQIVLDEFIAEQEKEIEGIREEHSTELEKLRNSYVQQLYELQQSHTGIEGGSMEKECTNEEDNKVNYAQENQKLKREIRCLEEQCARIGGGILEDKEALGMLRGLTLDKEKDSTSLISISDGQHPISASILTCYSKTQEHIKDQCKSWVDALLKVFDSVLGNLSSEINSTSDPTSSDNQQTRRISAKQYVEELLNADGIKPDIHKNIENTFNELATEYATCHDDITRKIECLTQEINQLKEQNSNLLDQTGDLSKEKVNVESENAETEAKLQRLQRQEEESSNFINMLQNDIKKLTNERNALEEEINSLKKNSKDIVGTIIKSEELLHEKLDEIIDNQLSGCNLSQYGLDASFHSNQGKDNPDASLIEMPINLAAETDEPEFLKGVSTRFSDTVDHFLQVLSLVFSDFKNTSLQDSKDVEADQTTYEDDDQTEENGSTDVVEGNHQNLLLQLENKVNKHLDVTKEIEAIKESINLKDILISNLEMENEARRLEIKNIQGDLDKSLSDEANLENFIEIQDSSMTGLEVQLGNESEKNKELVAAKESLEKDITSCRQQISCLGEEIEIKCQELNKWQDTLQEKIKKEARLEHFIEKQDVMMKGLENQLTCEAEKNKDLVAANKDLQDDKERYQQCISNLEKTCSNQTDIISANNVNLEENETEIEALKCAIKNQQTDIDKLKEQLIKKQMLMDAKECQLIEMEEQLKKENQKYLTELEGAFDDQAALKHSLEEKLKEVKDLKDFIESKQVLICELEEQLTNHQVMVESKEKQCTDLTDELSKQKEKYESEYKKLASDKSKEISAIYKELEETLKEKDNLENHIKSQEASTLRLTEEFEKLNTLSNAKETKMAENEDQLKKEIAKLSLNLENMTSDKDNRIRSIENALEESVAEKSMLQAEVMKHQNDVQKLQDKNKADCEKLAEEIDKYKVLIDERQVQFTRFEEKLMKEKEKYTSDLKDLTSKNIKEMESIQNALDESMSEKYAMEDNASKYLEELNKMQILLDDKDAQIAEVQRQFSKQKEKHALDIKKLSGDKGKEITAIFNELEEKLKEKDALEDVVSKQETSILKLQEELNKHNVIRDTRDAKMNEREEMLKKEIEKLQLDLDNLTASKNEELANTQIALEEISRQKDEVEDLVNLKQAYISKLEEQLKESKVLLDEKVALLAGVEEHLAREEEKHAEEVKNLTEKKVEELNVEKSGFEHIIKKQLADIGELDKLKKECEHQIKDKEARLNEIEKELINEKKKHSEELKKISEQKNKEISTLQNELEKKCTDIIQLKEEIGEMENQLAEDKEKFQADIDRLNLHKDDESPTTKAIIEEKDQLAEMINQQQVDIAKLEAQLNDSKGLVEEKQIELSDVQEQLIEELNKSALSLQDVSMDKSEEISTLQNQLAAEKEKHKSDVQSLISDQKEKMTSLQSSFEQISKEKIQMQDVLNKQQAYIGELEEQMKKSKDFIDEKQVQLDSIEEQLMQTKHCHSSDLQRISDDFEDKLLETKELTDALTTQQAIVYELQEEIDQQKALLDERNMQLSELVKEKENVIYQVKIADSENKEAMATLQNTIDVQTQEKNELEISFENQRALMAQLEEQLNKHKSLVECKEAQFAQEAKELSKAKEKEVINLLNESVELKDLMSSLEERLEAKVNDEAELSDMLEQEKSFNAELENQVNEKNEELVALKQRMEKETTQHLADLEQISIVKDEMIETIQKTLEDQSSEKEEFEKMINNQHAIIAGLEEQLSAQKKMNDEKIVLLEERGQLLKSKDRSISELNIEIEDQENKTNAIQKSLQKIIEDQEIKRNVVEESLQQKLIQLSELNESIIALQGQNRDLRKKLEEQEYMLSDASNELDKSREEIEKISLGKEEEIANIYKQLETQTIANDDLGKLIQGQNTQISKTQVELNENKALFEVKCKELAEMKKQEKELLKNLKDSKDSLVNIKLTLEEKVKQEAELNALIDKQKNLISELERQVQELQAALNTRNDELTAFKKRLIVEKNQHEAELQEALLNRKEDTEVLQKEVKKSTREREELKYSIENQQNLVCDLEGQLQEYKDLLENTTRQLSESEQCKEEKGKVISELKKEQNELNVKIGNFEKTLKENAQKEIDLNESIQKQKGVVSELEKKLQQYLSSLKDKSTELSELKQQLSQERNQHMIDYEAAAAKQKETISHMEKVLDEEIKEKQEMKSYVESHETLAEELKKQLNEQKEHVSSNEKLLTEMKALHAKVLEKRNVEVEQAILEKAECISNLEKRLNDEIKKKNEVSNIMKRQEALINELEKQVNDDNNTMAKMEEEYEKAFEAKEVVNDKLEEQVAESKNKMLQLENDLEEVNRQLKALENIKYEFQNVTNEKEHQVSVLEKNFGDQIKETDELKDIVKRQQALVCELEEQLNQEKFNKNSREKEMDEMKESIIQRHKNQIYDLEKQLKEEKERLTCAENVLRERTNETNEIKEAVMKQKIKVTELQEQLNEQSVLLHAKDHELIETKESLLKEKAQQVQKWEKEKQGLIDTVNKLEEKILNMEYEIKKKGEELSQLQKAHQEMQLSHINEIMKLNNEHRNQIGTLMEIPQKDRNIKVLLMDLQKEADEVLDLVLNVPEVNENTPPERIETLKATWMQEKEMLLSIIDDMRKNAKENTNETSVVSNPLSSADVEDFTQDDGGISVASNVSEMRHDGRDEECGEYMVRPNRLQDQSETSTETPFANGHRHIKEAFLHDKGIVSEFEKLVNEESKKVEYLTAKLEEEVRLKESIQMAHEVELAKVVERELNLKEKYLKVAELLQKEKNAKTRVMEMLNDAQRLNEIQSQNLEEVQNDKNSLLESYTIVSELENLLSKEKEKVDHINTKLEKERYEKSALQVAFEDDKEELVATKDRENRLKEKCIELNKLLLKESEDRKNIADTLENEKKLMSMEKKNLEQKESALNQRLAKLGDGNPDQKLKTLKAWEEEVKKREKSLSSKEEKLKTLIKRIEQGYDILPQKQTKDSTPEKTDKTDDGPTEGNDWLKQIEGSQLLDTRHLPLVADLNQKIKSLQKEKVKLADTLTELKTEIVEYKQQLKDYQLMDQDNKKMLEDKEAKLNALSAVIHPTETIQDGLTADGQKLLNAGWTIAKVQRLYLKYFRAESFRKALVYQKRYLTLMVNENEANVGLINNNKQRRPSFKVVVLAVISIRRMKYLVKKYHRNLHKSSPEYQYKDKSRNSFKKKNAENVIDEFDHSPPGSRGITENGDNHVSSNGVSRNNSRKPQSTSTPAKANYPASKQSHYVPPATRLTLSDPNRLETSKLPNPVESSRDRHNLTEPQHNRLRGKELYTGTHSGGALVNKTNSLSRNHPPSLSLDNLYTNDDVPRSYPRPTGILPDEIPSRISGTNGDASHNNSRLEKSPYTTRALSSPPSPLLSSTTRDVREPNEDANESLSSYIHTLETLQNRLKKVGYTDRTRPSLL